MQRDQVNSKDVFPQVSESSDSITHGTEVSIVVHAYNPSSEEAEAGGAWVEANLDYITNPRLVFQDSVSKESGEGV